MNDRMGQEVTEWMKSSGVEPPDEHESAREVMAELPTVRRRSRWLPFPVRYQGSRPPSSPTDHEQTVTGRTRSMFSPAKTITAATLVGVVATGFLIATPRAGDDVATPGADAADPLVAVPFTGRLSPGSAFGDDIWTDAAGVFSHRECAQEVIDEATDARIDGVVTACQATDRYGRDIARSPRSFTESVRLENADGAWHGSKSGAEWIDPSSGELFHYDAEHVLLVGDGAYEGLVAALAFEYEDGLVRGIIFPAAMPEPVPLEDAG